MITPECLAAVTAALAENPDLGRLRAAFPALHFTECSEDDVSPRYRPAASTAGHELYLISGSSGHCLTLTHEAELATGILLASKVDDT
jgi:hypothetical protein